MLAALCDRLNLIVSFTHSMRAHNLHIVLTAMFVGRRFLEEKYCPVLNRLLGGLAVDIGSETPRVWGNRLELVLSGDSSPLSMSIFAVEVFTDILGCNCLL